MMSLASVCMYTWWETGWQSASLWRGFYPGILFDDGLLHGFDLLLEEVGGVLVVGQRLGHQLGGGILANQPHAAVLLGAASVRHFV